MSPKERRFSVFVLLGHINWLFSGMEACKMLVFIFSNHKSELTDFDVDLSVGITTGLGCFLTHKKYLSDVPCHVASR